MNRTLTRLNQQCRSLPILVLGTNLLNQISGVPSVRPDFIFEAGCPIACPERGRRVSRFLRDVGILAQQLGTSPSCLVRSNHVAKLLDLLACAPHVEIVEALLPSQNTGGPERVFLSQSRPERSRRVSAQRTARTWATHHLRFPIRPDSMSTYHFIDTLASCL